MKVMKFGGSSVQDASHIREVVSIIQSQTDVRAVICSAMKGVTDTLQSIAQLAEEYNLDFVELLQGLWERHEGAIEDLFADQGSENERENLRSDLKKDYTELCEICHGVSLIKECSSRSMDLIMSFGERMNNKIIVSYALRQGLNAFYVDARDLVQTNSVYGSGIVNFEVSYERIRAHFRERRQETAQSGIGIVTGFIASTADGITTTLGRNGSDYSASIFGAALGADSIEIWTDVDGILEIDPSIVANASVIDELSIDEAMELSYFGADVLHPSAIVPAMAQNIPVCIKNTMNPQAQGSRISTDARKNPNIITGMASISDVSLINIVGSGVGGMLNTSAKIFTALSKAGVNVLMLSQASSEQSICVVIRSQDYETAHLSLRTELKSELELGVLSDISHTRNLAIIAVIGNNMRGAPGVSGKIFQTLGDRGINIYAIAQGSSEINISFVVKKEERIASLKSLHAVFFQNTEG